MTQNPEIPAERLSMLNEKIKVEDILNLMLDGYWLVNNKGIVIDVNQSYCEMSGFSKEEIIGSRIANLQITDTEEKVKARLKKISEQGYDKFTAKHLKKDGNIFYCDVSVKKVKRDNDFLLICNMRDITEQRSIEIEIIRAKAQNIEIENRFKTVVDKLPIAIYMSKGIEQKPYFINKSFIEMFGYSREEVKNINNWFKLAYPDEKYRAKTVKEWNKRVETAIKNKSIIEPLEVIVACADGSHKTILWGFISTDKENWAYGIDLTEIRTFQKELIIAKEKAEASTKSKSEFLSNMSHEIRTPMHAIIGFTNLLLDRQSDEETKEFLSIIKESSDHLMNIINDILSLSKIEAGAYKVEKEKINLFERIDKILNVYEKQAELKGLGFKSNISKDLDKDIMINYSSILKILNNLLSNSLKFTKDGFVSISINQVKNNKIEIMIEDTGIGINKEKQDHLFQPFEQGEHYLTKEYGGTGLGLTIVKNLVDLLEGNITVETEIEKGTKFSIIIPYDEIDKGTEHNAGQKECKFYDTGLRIISAEDIEINQRLLEIMLKKQCSIFKKVYNGKELLDELEENDYDLILMDIQMPVINGIEATKRIRKNPKYKDLPIIVLSAYALEEDIKVMYDAGISDHISKPIQKKDFINKIKTWTKCKNAR